VQKVPWAQFGMTCGDEYMQHRATLKHSTHLVIDLVEASRVYQAFAATMRPVFAERLAYMDRILAQSEILGRWQDGYAICFRGSYGRGDPTQFSDVDIVIISDLDPRGTEDLRDALRQILHNYETSLWIYRCEVGADEEKALAFWQCLPYLRLGAGRQDVYDRFVSSSRSALRNLPLGMLLRLYSQEFKASHCSDPASPHFYSIKNGPGGLVEYEFVMLLKEWQELRGQRLSQDQERLVQVVMRHHQYASFHKAYLHLQLAQPVALRNVSHMALQQSPAFWFFCSEVAIRTLAFECHGRAVEFVGLVPDLN
jgi:hypothetical protein